MQASRQRGTLGRLALMTEQLAAGVGAGDPSQWYYFGRVS